MEVLNAPPPREVDGAGARPSVGVEAAILLLVIATVALAAISALGSIELRLAGHVRDSLSTGLQATTATSPAYGEER